MNAVFITELADAAEKSASAAELCAIVRTGLAPIGIHHVCYHVLSLPDRPDPHPLIATTYDEAWVRHYIAQDYFLIDPVVMQAQKDGQPFEWDRLATDKGEVAGFFAEARRHDVGCQGLSIPIRARAGESALLTLTSNRNRRDWHAAHLWLVQNGPMLADGFHECVMKLDGLRQTLAEPVLTFREKRLLQYCANGLSPKQIAGKLDVSPTAVNASLAAIKKKMGCFTITKAVVMAVKFRIITI